MGNEVASLQLQGNQQKRLRQVDDRTPKHTIGSQAGLIRIRPHYVHASTLLDRLK